MRPLRGAQPLVTLVLALVAVSAGKGCVSTSRPAARPSVIDLAEPTPGTTALPVTKPDFDREIADLERRLAAGADRDACLRLAALSRHALGQDVKDAVGLSRFGYGALSLAEGQCPTDPEGAAQSLTALRNNGPAPLPPGSPLQ